MSRRRFGALAALGAMSLAALPAEAAPQHVPRPSEEQLEHHRPTRLPSHPEDSRREEAPLDGRHPLLLRARARGTGTAMLPDTTPLRAFVSRSGAWVWLLQGDVVYGTTQQGGLRSQAGPVGDNWQLLTGSTPVGPGIADLFVMTSLEPWTVGPGGAPQLLQGGQTFQGQPLLDRRHPRDLLGEAAARWTWPLGAHGALHLYGGLVGEPALGPGAARRRSSAADHHAAPLAAGMLEAAQASQGVVTGGLRLGPVTLEGSAFRGREPDEDRVGIVLGPLDSWAVRVGWQPDPRLTLQASTGLVGQPTPLVPGDLHRTTASAVFVQPVPAGYWSSALVWGRNDERRAAGPSLQGLGLESQYDIGATHLYGRAEWVERVGLGLADPQAVTRVGAFTLGLARDLEWLDSVALAVGADATTYSLDASSRAAYGDGPLSWRVYVRLRPPTLREEGR